jgi:hypothetical protein
MRVFLSSTRNGHSRVVAGLVRQYWRGAVQFRGLALLVATRILKCVFILGLLLPPAILADPLLDSGAGCTHVFGLDQIDQVRQPIAAGPNAIQETRKIYIDHFGKPKFERQMPDGVALTWVITEGYSTPIAQNVIIHIVQGTLHVTCGTAF